ncbi:MAG: hypothetical protein ACLP50_31605, partial [Solirubrobacteraceae bacterium]
MAGDYKLIIDGAALAEILHSPSGPVGRDLIVRATRVQMRARQILGPHRKTGCLEDSLVKRAETFGGELAIRIQSDTTSCSERRESYSLFVHEGTPAHDIPGAFGYPPPFGIGGRFEG